MSLLRIHASFPDPPLLCQWALLGGDGPATGESPLAGLPKGARRIQLVLPSTQVLITRARLPTVRGRRNGALLAYAVEERTGSEPESNQVSKLGTAGQDDVLAVVDRQGLHNWQAALGAAGIHGYQVCCETLMLPWTPQVWSLAWTGCEGFVRTGELEGAATDRGDRDTPPLSLQLLIETARARGETPSAIALYLLAPEALPDLDAWRTSLGVDIVSVQDWDWRTAAVEPGVSLVQESRRWHPAPGTVARLRSAAWILGIAMAIHALGLVGDWTRLASEKRALHARMETRFRAVFPDTVAVADPVLQMRRKLAEARHAAHQPDAGDFAVMMPKVANGLRALPPGSLRVLSYENARITLALAAIDPVILGRTSTTMSEAELDVETRADAGRKTVTLNVTAR